MSTKHYIKRYANNKTLNFEKLWGKQVFENTTVICFNLLQVCPSVPPFVFAILFILLFMFWAVLFMSHSVCLTLNLLNRWFSEVTRKLTGTEFNFMQFNICIVAFCQSGVEEKQFSETLLNQNRISKPANSSPKGTVASLGSKVVTFSIFFL